jgi:hypothetical protein
MTDEKANLAKSFFAKSTFFHAGQREKMYFFHAEITFFLSLDLLFFMLQLPA